MQDAIITQWIEKNFSGGGVKKQERTIVITNCGLIDFTQRKINDVQCLAKKIVDRINNHVRYHGEKIQILLESI